MTAYGLIRNIIRDNPDISDTELIQQVYGTILESQGQSIEELSALGVLNLVASKKLPALESVPRLKRMALRDRVGSAPVRRKLKLF